MAIKGLVPIDPGCIAIISYEAYYETGPELDGFLPRPPRPLLFFHFFPLPLVGNGKTLLTLPMLRSVSQSSVDVTVAAISPKTAAVTNSLLGITSIN
jgi:hypothetical protein